MAVLSTLKAKKEMTLENKHGELQVRTIYKDAGSVF